MVRDIIIGNVCSLCAMVSDSVSSTRNKRNQILAIQILSQVFYGVGSILLKGYSGTAQNLTAIFRNLAAMKNIKSKAVEWVIILLGVVLGIVFNNRGLIGWLPIVANLEYSVAVFRFKDNERGLKAAFLVNMLMFFAFSLVIMNYVAAAGNIVVAVTTAIALIKGRKKNAEAAADEAQTETEIDTEDPAPLE